MLQNELRQEFQNDDTALLNKRETHVTLAERRNASRIPVIKSAKIIVGGDLNQGVYNCLVLDESATGVLVDLGAMLPLPEAMTLKMTGGATFRARRCWAVGTKAGLAFHGPQSLSPEATQLLRQLRERLPVHGLPVTIAVLRTKRYFENEELRDAAEAAEAAYQRLEAVLNR
jgi:hypothetical protein